MKSLLPWVVCGQCSGLQKPRLRPLWTHGIFNCQAADLYRPEELQVVTECPRSHKISIFIVFNVLSYGTDTRWVYSFILTAGKRTQTNIPRMRIALAEKASYWLSKSCGQLDPFQPFRESSCSCKRSPLEEESFYNFNKSQFEFNLVPRPSSEAGWPLLSLISYAVLWNVHIER